LSNPTTPSQSLRTPGQARDGDSEIRFPQSSAEELTKEHWKNLLLVLPFLVLFFIQLAHHQMWRDELHAWGIERASPTLAALFHNLHYEGHPTFWYLLLWPAARWTASPIALKFVEAVIAAAIYLVIGLWSPFSRLEKALLLLSYFISFEYTVISRAYSLFLLVALLYVHVRTRRPSSPIPAAILLGILANIDFLGVILSGAFVTEWVCNQLALRRRAPRPSYRRYYAGAAIYLLSLAISYQSTKLAKDISWRTTGHMFQYATNLHHLAFATAAYAVSPFLPVGKNLHFYWSNPVFSHPQLYFALVPVAIAAVYILFRHDRRLLALVGLTTLGGIAFSHLIYYPGSTRHFGVVFVALLAALWIQRFQSHRRSALVYTLFTLFALSGVTAAIGQWVHPFSNAGATAHWIQSRSLQHLPIVGTPDTSLDGVAQELQQPVYFLDCSCTDTLMRFASRRDSFDESQIPERLKLAAIQLHAPEMILIMVRPLTPAEVAGIEHESLAVTPLAEFTGAVALQEDFYLYKVASATANAPR
jgi:hypothetical protein